MWSKKAVLSRRWVVLPVVLLGLLVAGCGSDASFEESFDSVGDWGAGSEESVEGDVANGVYEMFVKADTGLYWATKGNRDVGAGVYELEATQLEGTLDNGYGMMYGVDSDNDNFYLFEVSGDGFVWIGYCESGCETVADPIVGEGWFESKAVREGLNEKNLLRVSYDGSEMVFAVNGQEVGRASGTDIGSAAPGDVGLMVETLGEGGVLVSFDNFRYMPLAEE